MLSSIDTYYIMRIIIVMNIAMLLKHRRLEMGLSQVALAAESGVSLPSIQLIEAGRGNPSWETLEKLFHVVELSVRIDPIPFSIEEGVKLGLPLSSDTVAFSNTSDAQDLVSYLRKAALYLKSTRIELRLGEAIRALILALLTHYPGFLKKHFSRDFLKSLNEQVKVPSHQKGRLIKLQRMARARLGEYL